MNWKEYARAARLAAAEGIVMLRNKKKVLPLKRNERIAVFGRIQFDYYKSGTGSGGMVNVPYSTNIVKALKESKRCTIDENLEEIYRAWVKEHPFDKIFIEKDFWTIEPWAQEEMPVSDDIVKKAKEENDIAMIILGRTAGEERDSLKEKGSWYLSETEEDMLAKVTKYFEKTVVILNVAGIMDMQWVERYNPSAVLYVWQGGMEGGNAVADVLLGKINPCGKLSDTIAKRIEDYPADANFGNTKENIYQEDIYVGYRYFNTFEPEQIQYPFGYGLSYTKFEWKTERFDRTEPFSGNPGVHLWVRVKNTGDADGKEVIQVYLKKPEHLLGNPEIVLAGFLKTSILAPGEEQVLKFFIPESVRSSYDDSGKSGYKEAWIVEKGKYVFYIGNSSTNLKEAGKIQEKKTRILEQLEEVLAPITDYERLIPEENEDHTVKPGYEPVPVRTADRKKRIEEERKNLTEPMRALYQGERGWKLQDVAETRKSMEQFLSQFSDEELACLVRGEGMRSPKVTSGTAAAFGGVTDVLKEHGIPVACCADGPSGIRRDDGHLAFSIPIGTALACTFNLPLVETLFTWMGKELKENKIDLLLGPGMNIHRHPLNGRNFEYFSEDPLLSGKMAAAEIRGIRASGVSGTLKHFTANNQELARTECNAVVSERALREIYLKGFQIAMEESDPLAVMSTYGPVNGIWTASNYELLTMVLRKEWKYDGLVMTDWEAHMNSEEGQEATEQNTCAMIQAQNDLYMVVEDSATNAKGDNTVEGIEKGRITREELLRSAENICRVLIKLFY